jgi:RNA polymerase sigma-70 factor, ECF subfamily
MPRTDEELVQAYLDRHDQAAFRTLVERHKDRIYGYLLGMVHRRDLADDLFQETFYRVISALQKQRGSYEQQGRWLAWVMRIARNATLDHLRKRKKWQDMGDHNADYDTTYWERLPGDEPAADHLLERAETRDMLEGFIGELPPEQREVLLLRQETDLTFREIGELTDVSINTALGRMRYALANLRKMIRQSRRKTPTNVN